MPRPIWFRSLYWRIALGFVAMLAALLLVQGMLFLWLTGRFALSTASRTPQQLVDQVARELSEGLAENPSLDLQAFVTGKYGDVTQGFAVMMRDGRRAVNRPGVLPPGFGERFRRLPPMEPGGGFDRPERFGDRDRFGDRERFGERMGPPPPDPEKGPGAPPSAERDSGPQPDFTRRRPGGGRGGPGGPPVHLSPVVVNGTQVGLVATPTGPPPIEVLLRELGPTLTWTGLGLLSAGSMMVALLIFRPAAKRLRSLEEAARAVGEGRTEVRADDSGGDEVSALAHTFNHMAGELEARTAALSASDKARRQLLADVSHELMTPLTAIRGYTQTLAMPGLAMDEPTRGRYFDIVDRETYKLEAIIGDLLDLAKLEGGGSTLTLEDVPVDDLFERIAERHDPILSARNIELVRSVVPEDLELEGDLQRLEQALQNVASNAVRHTPDGGRLELRGERAGDRVRIVVRDTGPGIPPEHLPHVFDRFYKADASRTATGAASGSGLGLSIVRAIVERHGGTVTASNAPDGGAVFEFLFPRGGGGRPPPPPPPE
jgi:signal transduction histidine kinase